MNRVNYEWITYDFGPLKSPEHWKKKNLYCWKATAKWNIAMENIFEERTIKIEKAEDENL